MKLAMFRPLGLLLVPSLCAVTSAQNYEIFVDASASGGNDGSSWTDAYTSLQDGIDDVSSPPGGFTRYVVMVAEGSYVPTTTWPSAGSPIPEERTFLFTNFNDIEVRGGFLGIAGGAMASVTPELPDGALFDTKLTGEISSGVNSYHTVVFDTDQATTTLLRGFSVEDGDASGAFGDEVEGGGIYFTGDGDQLIERVRIQDNRADEFGGGVFISKGDGEAQMKNCTIRDNIAKRGAGIYSETCRLLNMVNVTIRNNGRLTAPFGDPLLTVEGGGVYFARDVAVHAANCVLYDNAATNKGGGVFYQPFTGNQTGQYFHVWRNCTFAFNSLMGTTSGTSTDGAGMHIQPGAFDGVERIQEVFLLNSILHSNSAGRDLTVLGNATDGGIQVTANFCDVGTTNTTSVTGMGFYNGTLTISADPLFKNPALRNLQLRVDLIGPNTSPCVDNGANLLRGLDLLDLDGDMSTTERLPLDRQNLARLNNITFITGSLPGSGTVDMGAFEARINATAVRR